jgi:hypothetical protein
MRSLELNVVIGRKTVLDVEAIAIKFDNVAVYLLFVCEIGY